MRLLYDLDRMGRGGLLDPWTGLVSIEPSNKSLNLSSYDSTLKISTNFIYIYIYIYINYCSATGHRITYFVATLSYDNYYANLPDYSNSLLSDLL